MRTQTAFSPARRTLRRAERRFRRRPVLVAATLAIGVLASAGFTSAAPASQAAASGTLSNFSLASFTTASVTTVTGADAHATTDDVFAGASAAVTAATTVASDIAASGLDVGTTETSIDTSELEAAVTQLQRAQALPAVHADDFTTAVTSLTATVNEQAQGLRGKLDAAIALKAQQEAEEKARKEAEAAAAAAKAEAEAAAAAAKKSSGSSAPSPVYATGGAVGGTSPADAQATARAMLGGYGWGDDQFGCLVSLWQKESGWNYQAYNRSSGAFGIPQALPGSKMGSAGADWQTNPATQIAWGLGYISGRYGTPCGAWGHSQSTGWY
ncbi:lytic transglycosylase domain-containing protein [Microbacterium sp. M3]|uniref:Lytic transglycosylase domain-containing protein n=1 Tax=Microbacterium arthrosphaerae TaxID=792652 RepID=A0ABU4GWY8_9MICO|nr:MULTISPECIES: lytic transglycosylase domain-containing protein [Microbacterium]MDW4571583.1 lytic transglycosylase domain-containing protein [Microbacterium arthrosphaerae]MDW7605438.1 lytic transglycosylase domain-containing protein [Microbacterium sp. M3]